MRPLGFQSYARHRFRAFFQPGNHCSLLRSECDSSGEWIALRIPFWYIWNQKNRQGESILRHFCRPVHQLPSQEATSSRANRRSNRYGLTNGAHIFCRVRQRLSKRRTFTGRQDVKSMKRKPYYLHAFLCAAVQPCRYYSIP